MRFCKGSPVTDSPTLDRPPVMRDQVELASGDQGVYHRLEVVGQQGQAIIPGFSGLAGLAGTTDIVTDHQITPGLKAALTLSQT